MKQFKFRALVTFDSLAPAHRGPEPGHRLDPSQTHAIMIYVWQADQPTRGKYFPAAISRDDELPLLPGQRQVVTITITDDQAPLFLAPGRQFTIWGGGSGRGVVSRRVFTASGPS